ncbi:MAG: protein kinase [Cyanothece sp. SIO1E1]|nr:protein kinase [Cyanothece sp. SIO1E1]
MICCLNPNCNQPQNPDDAKICQSCNTELIPLLRNHYHPVQPIGEGGFGRTYLALDVDRLNTRCVIKQFVPKAKGTKSREKAIILFKQEAVRLHQLGEHPQIPTLLAYFEKNNYLYLVQQFIEGPTLLRELKQQGALNEEKLRGVLNDLLPVLKFIHEHQVIHRDITPTNIIRRRADSKLVLIDFGIAKQINDVVLGQSGTKIGTEGYAPIEQLRNGKVYPSSDLYSLGATCLYLLTQTKPDDLYNPLNGRWLWREQIAKSGIQVSQALGYVLDKLVKDLVSERYQSATDVLKDLNSSPLHLSVSSPPASDLTGATPTSSSDISGSGVVVSQTSGANATGDNTPTSQPPTSKPPISKPPISKPLTSKPPITPPPTSRPPTSQPPVTPTGVSKPPISRPRTSGQTFSRSRSRGWNCVHLLTGHSSWVTTVALSPISPVVASGSLDDTIRLWNLQTGALLNILKGHSRGVNAVAMSPHGSALASCSDDDTVKIWDLRSREALYTLRGHSRDVNSVAISSKSRILVSGGEDRSVRLWRLDGGGLIRMLSGATGMIKSVAISSDEQIVASGGLDNRIALWSLKTGEMTQTLRGHFNSVNAIAISPDNKLLASGSKDKTIKLWDLQTGALLNTLEGHAREVNAVVISADGKILMSSSTDATIKIWDLQTRKLCHTLTGHANSVTALAASANGRTLVSGSLDNTVRIWRFFR